MKTAGKPVEDIRVGDIGCGTGLHVELFARKGVRSVVGFDKSKSMISQAKKSYPEREFLVGDATVATMATADQFDLMTAYYFTIYLVPDRTTMLKNIYLWLSAGGIFCCHIVNKLKFDPILESASPFLGFSLQKYADERVTKSQVTFKEFEYTGDFQLHGSRGMYEEEFVFADGRKRRHEQRVWMPNIDLLVGEITAAGWIVRHVDADRERDLVRRFAVTGVPCYVLLVKGQEVGRINGATTRGELEQLLAKSREPLGLAALNAPPAAASMAGIPLPVTPAGAALATEPPVPPQATAAPAPPGSRERPPS
jgi:SAM-dependent methyltransferase